MSKICKNCGVKHENSAKKCAMCGTEFNDKHIYAKRKKLIILVICGAVLLATAIVFIIYLTGPKAAVRRIMDAHKRVDAETVISYFPDFLLESDKIDGEKFIMETEATVNGFSRYLFSFNLEKAETPSDREIEELLETFEYFGGENFDESEVRDIKMVWVNYKGNVQGFWPSHGTRFIMFKYDGSWYWWPNNVNR